MKKWSLLFYLLLLAGCQNWGSGRVRNKLKILNSFSEGKVISQIWPDLFAAFQCRYKNIDALAMNVAHENVFERLKRMAALQSLPNVLYMRADSLAAEYLIDNNLLQNLRSEQQSEALFQLGVFPAALSPQGHGQNTLWFLPLTINVSNVLFVNEQLLTEEGLRFPESIEELAQSVEFLRARGYQYPLLAHPSYVDDILHNLLSTLVAWHIGPDFFYRATEEPELFQSNEFRAVIKEYTSYLGEDGILPPAVRKLDAGSSLRYFNLGLSAFMLAKPEVSEFFVGGKSGAFSWRYLPVRQDLAKGLEGSDLVAAGRIEPGYGITRETSSSPVLKEQALQFLNFIFTDGLELYQQEDVSYTVFSVPLQNSGLDSVIYANKKDFYHSRSLIINDIRAQMFPGRKYELLMDTIERFMDGSTTMERVVSLFYSSALQHNKAHARIGSQTLRQH